MDPIVGGAIASGAGSMVSSAANFLLQRNQRDWQEKMANTAYQRATADMTKAGLNPALMYGSAGKADTPNVAPAQVKDPTENVFSAVNAARTLAEVEAVRAQIARTKVDTARSALDLGYASEYGGKKMAADIQALQASALRDGNSALNLELERPLKGLLGQLGRLGSEGLGEVSKFGDPGSRTGGAWKLLQKLYNTGGPFKMLYDAISGGDASPGRVHGGANSAKKVGRLNGFQDF